MAELEAKVDKASYYRPAQRNERGRECWVYMATGKRWVRFLTLYVAPDDSQYESRDKRSAWQMDPRRASIVKLLGCDCLLSRTRWYNPLYEARLFDITVSYDVEQAKQRFKLLMLICKRACFLPRDVLLVVGGFLNRLLCFL
jgi:hypothetical protein